MNKYAANLNVKLLHTRVSSTAEILAALLKLVRLKIDGFLKRSYGYGFTKEIFHIQTIIDSVTCDLFNKVKASNHCLYHLLPPQRPLHDALGVRGHQFQLPNCIYKFHK